MSLFRSCFQYGGPVSVHIVSTGWWACLCSDRVYRVVGVSLFSSCLQDGGRVSFQVILTESWTCLRSCVYRVIGVSQVVFAG